MEIESNNNVNNNSYHTNINHSGNSNVNINNYNNNPNLVKLISSDTNKEFFFNRSFINVNNTINRITIKEKYLNLINKFYLYHYINKIPFGFKAETLVYNDFKKNFINVCNCEIVMNLEYTDIVVLLGVAEKLNLIEIIELCCAKLADYYKKLSNKDLEERFLITEPLNEMDINIFIMKEPVIDKYVKKMSNIESHIK